MSMIDFEDDQFITIESIVIVFSALLFTLINRLLFCLQSRLRSDHKLLDDRIALESYRIWKWRNIVVSLIHSTISGIISLYLSFENNHLRLSGSSKMVPSRNLLDRKRCICFSIGYFLYDSLLSIANYRKYPDRLEIIIHHLITTITLGQIFCPIIRVRFPKLIDYCSYGLVIEISNIFIHIRSLGYISDFWSNNLLLFKLNSFLAIGKRN
ncbi:rho GTPase-activating protein 17 [Sarcoptes scabiei]|nr:rho GTPase-activating protein 17 [Sarcoptes scabiei]